MTRAGRYSSLRDEIADFTKGLFRSSRESTEEEFWALRDLSFSIEAGERVGIIGRNGAGKSTLLKILSRITEPSAGRVRIKGRVASLLEVGTGFHPELTGRENIYLNGAILGMRRDEVRRKFDEIVAFAEIEQFLDTPVKRYSSGMYVRLAFAVAAHLEPEILVVDEVLAVGDAQFQKKCMGKMEEVSRGEGRTVLFVSHNMQAISTLCTHGIFLRKGQAEPKMSARDAIAMYAQHAEITEVTQFPLIRSGVTIHDFRLEQNGMKATDFESQLPIDIIIEFEVPRDTQNFRIGFFVKTAFGELLNRSLLADWREDLSTMKRGRYRIKGSIPPNLLNASNYIVQVHASQYGLQDYMIDEATSTHIRVQAPEQYNKSYLGENTFGQVLIRQNWVIDYV